VKKAIVLGAGGFIGSHLVKRLKREGYWVRGVDLKYPEFSKTLADEFFIEDLRDYKSCVRALTIDNIYEKVNEVYQLAADMGGAGFVFIGDHDADIMHNSAQINLNIISLHEKYKKIFYSSSACMYPLYNQLDQNNPKCSEDSAYPAAPDSEYGWEKLFSERLYLSYKKNYGVDIRIARFHNIFGEEGTWKNGREKAPAALCRKVAETKNKGIIEIWGDGSQTRSFLYIDECLEGIRRLMESDFVGPVNIGSEEMIAINDLAKMIIEISSKKEIQIKNIDGPVGVRGRNSDNRLIQEKLNWKPSKPLKEGIKKLYNWIDNQVNKKDN
jgi:GDP-D-mannose 3', 5'-epimerase